MNTTRAQTVRLHPGNLASEYPDLGAIVAIKSLGGQALMQKNYGKAQDCTLTSLAFVFGANYYGLIEQIATRHGYNGDTSGTNPLTIKCIMREICQTLHINKHCGAAYCKGVGYNYKSIQRLIDGGTYALLNMWHDGRGYYRNHTVTIIGYLTYRNHRFLEVYDNWTAAPSYVDYDKLSPVSSLNWTEK